MKFFLKLMGAGLVGLLALTACGPTAAEPTAAPPAPVAVETPATEAPALDPTDVTLVANTGRPQFLNSFATW